MNGHVESEYSVATGEWSTPRFVEDPFIKIHGLAPGLNYGQQAFEGMKGMSLHDMLAEYKANFLSF